MPKKREFVECPVCTSRVDARAVVDHWKLASCQARVIANQYDARGWVMIDETRAKVVRETSVPFEEALGGYHCEEVAYGQEDKGSHRRLKTRWEERLHKVVFVPKGVARVLTATAGLNAVDKVFRRRMLEALWDQGDDILAQIDTVRRLNGSVRSYLWRLVISAEEAKGTGKTDPAAQVTDDGKERPAAHPRRTRRAS